MMKFEDLRSILSKPDLSAADLTDALRHAKVHRGDAASALDAIESRRGDMILASDSERLAFRSSLSTAKENIEDAVALIEVIQQRLSKALAAEAERARRELRANAEAQSEAARKSLLRYSKLAREIVEIIDAVARADEAIRQSNSDLPAGASPLLSPEHQVRGRPGSDERLISDEIVTLWAFSGSGEPLPDELLDQVQQSDRGAGWIPAPESSMGSLSIEVVRRRFRRVERIPAVAAVHRESLSRTVNLPGLAYLDPMIAEPSRNDDGRSVLLHPERLRSIAPRRDGEIEPVVDFIPISDAVEDPVTPARAPGASPGIVAMRRH